VLPQQREIYPRHRSGRQGDVNQIRTQLIEESLLEGSSPLLNLQLDGDRFTLGGRERIDVDCIVVEGNLAFQPTESSCAHKLRNRQVQFALA
jgi:hypothetical protein